MNKLLFPFALLVNLLIITPVFSQWQKCPNDLIGGEVFSLARCPAGLLAGTENGGIFLSSDNGNTWTPKNQGISTSLFYSIKVNGDNIYAASNNGGIYVSTNNGDNWMQTFYSNDVYNPTCLALSKDYIFLSTESGMFISSNGTDWMQKNTGLTNFTDQFDFAVAVNDNYAFVGASSGVFVSSNNGDSWQKSVSGLELTSITVLEANNNYVFAGGWTGLALSTDNGATWNTKMQGLTSSHIYCITLYNNYTVIGTDGGVFVSSDFGDSWQHMNDGITSTDVYCLYIDGNTIYAGSNNGIIYKADISSLGIVSKVEETRCNNEFAPYPQPATDYVEIPFCSDEPATIEVYSASGNLIETIEISDIKDKLILNTEKYLSGKYFVTVKSGNRSDNYMFIIAK
jgi:photosystem II stability/assembly factor-like uncharacterized protein